MREKAEQGKNYKCKCMVPGCGKDFEGKAKNAAMAVKNLLVVSEKHNYLLHPELPRIFTEKKKELILKNLRWLGIWAGCWIQFVNEVKIV